MSRRHKKFFRIYVLRSRKERRKMIKKILPNLCSSAKLHTGVVMLQSLHFSQVLCDPPSSCILWSPPLAVFRLVHMLGFPLHVHLYAPLGPPPPGAVPAPSETTTTMTIGENTSKGGWVGAGNRVENGSKVI